MSGSSDCKTSLRRLPGERGAGDSGPDMEASGARDEGWALVYGALSASKLPAYRGVFECLLMYTATSVAKVSAYDEMSVLR